MTQQDQQQRTAATSLSLNNRSTSDRDNAHSLPTEIWIRIFSLEYTDSDAAPHLPSWEPWLSYRLVDRRFKDIIEGLCFSRFLRSTAIVVESEDKAEEDAEVGDDEDPSVEHVADNKDRKLSSRNEFYDFVGFRKDAQAEADEAGAEEGGGRGGGGGGDRFAAFQKTGSEEGGGLRRRRGRQPDLSSLPPRHNYHSNILVRIGVGATDLLPSGLHYVPSKALRECSTFIFDWRAYFSALFTEIKNAASVRETCWLKKVEVRRSPFPARSHPRPSSLVHSFAHFWQSPTAVANADSHPQNNIFLDSLDEEKGQASAQSLVQLGTSLYQKEAGGMKKLAAPGASNSNGAYQSGDTSGPLDSAQDSQSCHDEDDHLLLTPHIRTKLILAAGTYDIGVDGRYREVRRQRRRKFWEHEKQAIIGGRFSREDASLHESEEERTQRMAFERLDEGRVARRLLMLQVELAERGRAVEW